MKHLKKILFILILFTVFQVTYSSPLGVDTIEVTDKKILKATLSENPNMIVWEIDAEITILNDVKLRWGFAHEESPKKVELLLEDPIMANTNYSLLTILGAEGSIDFTTGVGIEWYVSTNVSSTNEQDIDSIEVIDDRTLLLTYRQDLTSSTFEYKLLAENEVVAVEKLDYDVPELTITVENDFKSEQDYILMFIDIQDIDGKYLEFDTGIYDFTTEVIEVLEELVVEWTGALVEWTGALVLEEVVEWTGALVEWTGALVLEEVVVAWTGAIVWEDEKINLDAASEDTSLEKDTADSSTEGVAMGAEATPETWATTWVLVLLTLVINSFYYFARRKKLQVS